MDGLRSTASGIADVSRPAGAFRQAFTRLLCACVFLGMGAEAHAGSPEKPAALEHLSLERAEKLFSQHNRELQAARRNAEGAEADILSASAPPNPDLSIGTSRISPRMGIGSGRLTDKRVDTVIGLTQLFERGNKRELRTETARFLATAARNDEGEVARQQKLRLHLAYYDLMLSQERLKIATMTAGFFEKSVQAAERRLSAGDIAATELSRIRVDALRALNDVRSMRAELEHHQLSLAYLIGTEADAKRLFASDNWPGESSSPQPGVPGEMLESRPDMLAARARVSAAEKNRDLARSLRTRDITAGLQYERFPGDAANNSYGFTISIPIFARNQYTGEIRRAETELEAAREDLQRVRALALDEIRRADSGLGAAAERVRRLLDVLLPMAEKNAQTAEFAHERGATGIMDLLDTRRQLYAIRLEAVAAKADHAKALAARRGATTTLPD